MITVYTAIFDKTHTLQQPDCNYGNDVEWVVLTDQNIVVPHPWKQEGVDEWVADDPDLKMERSKVLSHQILDSNGIIVWIDSTVKLQTNPAKLVEQVSLENPIGVVQLDDKGCVYKRARNNDNVQLRHQVDLYEYRGYPRNNGISNTSILVRRPDNNVKWFEWSWWLQVQTFTPHLWASFDYTLWEMGMQDNVVLLDDVAYTKLM